MTAPRFKYERHSNLTKSVNIQVKLEDVENCSEFMTSYSLLKTGNPARARLTSLSLLHNNPAE